MLAASRSGFLLQVPLSDQIQDTLSKIQEAPMVARVITICVLLMIVLGFLEKYFKTLSSLLCHLLKIRQQMMDLGTDPTAVDLDTQTERDNLLKAFKIKLENRLEDVLGTDQLIALSYEGRPEEVGRYRRPVSMPEAIPESSPTFMARLQSLNPIRLLK